MKQLRIPMSRIAVLIGHEGETKKDIEEKTGVELDIDSRTGEVTIILDEEGPEASPEDPLLSFKVEYIVKAIGRGFSPEKALLLLRDDMYFKLIDIRDYSGKSSNAQHRLKARLIGEHGKTREIIEELSEVKIVVAGYSVSLIGDYYHLGVAETAVDMLLHGARHAQVYSFLEKKRREAHQMKQAEI